MTRTAHASDHDLFVALDRIKDGAPAYAYAIAKRSYRIGETGIEPMAVRPLRKDPYDPECTPRLPSGSDFWWQKRRTDVVVEGAACAAEGKPIEEMEVGCSVGHFTKRVAVFGRRYIEYTVGGNRTIGAPQPFERMPLTDELAYGGVDPRIAISLPRTLRDFVMLAANHPGQYARNPVGTGYLALQDRIDDFELPNLEDPDDLLTDDRLCAQGPARWYRQPLPWNLGWQHAMSFTRLAFLGAEARFPAPEPGELEEVKRGFLPADYRTRAKDDPAFGLGFYQEASLGMSFEPLASGTPISVSGVHPERATLSLSVPEPPHIEITVEAQAERVKPRLTAVVVEPDALCVSFVYCARTDSLPRVFIPRIHPVIPLSARVDEGDPLHYEAPPVVELPPPLQ